MDGNILWIIVIIGVLNVIGGIALFSKMKAPPPQNRYKPRPHGKGHVPLHQVSPDQPGQQAADKDKAGK